MNINGIIIKGIGGFYYVEAADGIIYECKARGVFRKEKITPLAGDRVVITVDENNKNSIDKISERKNFFKRPPIANVDKLVIVSSVCDPKPNLLIIDRLTAVAVYKNVEPIIVFTKDDLQSADEYVDIYTKSGFKTFSVSNETGAFFCNAFRRGLAWRSFTIRIARMLSKRSVSGLRRFALRPPASAFLPI